MADVPPPWEDSDASEEAQHNAWNHLLELFTLQGSSQNIQQYLKEEELCKSALTSRRSNPGEIGVGAHGSQQGILLERRARLVAVSVVVHSFSSDELRETYLKAGEKVDGLVSSNL